MDRFNPAHLDRLLSEQRDHLMPSAQILDLLPLRPDATMGAIGCGLGFFTLPQAERVPRGLVHAIDVEPIMLEVVAERADAAGLTNIRALLATEGRIPPPPASLDGAFPALVYHELPECRDYLAMLGHLLRPQGWLALLERDRKPNPGGGPPLDRRIPPDEASADLAASGWRVAAQHDANAWMYLLVAERDVAASE